MFFSSTAAPNEAIFSMDHPSDEEIQVCSNKVTGVTNDHILRDIVLYRLI